MKKILFSGCGTALATPFKNDSVNLKEFKKLIEFQISNGVNALIVCGTTGEATTMTLQEKIDTIKCAVETSKEYSAKTSGVRVPVIVGTGSNNTKQAIEMSKIAKTLGADGLLIVTPYYNKTTQEGLIAHYSAIAKEVSLPIILYNVPSRTGVNILPQTCLELSKIENIVAIKEASGNLSQVAEIAHLCGDNLHIYSGNDDQILPVLSLGGIGVISVLSNVKPKLTCNIVNNFSNGNIKTSIELQLKSIPLIKSLFSEVNPIPVKAALNIIGFDFGLPRLPLVEMSNANAEILKKELSTI